MVVEELTGCFPVTDSSRNQFKYGFEGRLRKRNGVLLLLILVLNHTYASNFQNTRHYFIPFV